MTVIGVCKGGLGNNLFEICTSLAYSLKHGISYYIPTEIENPHYADQQVIQRPKLRYLHGSINDLSGKIDVYYEPHFHYKEIPKFNCDYLVLNGYFQSSYHFSAYKKEILHLLELDNIRTKKDVCSIHYRSGDYNLFQHLHPKVTEDYLKAAITYMWFENYKKFLVFSDSIEEMKQIISSFTMYNDLEFEYSENKTEVEDLIEMASCSANIISNSSFSWWAQYINPNPEKIIVAPKKDKWFGRSMRHNVDDLYMPNWVLI